ncbi:FecCD family ABC transporter permease [Halotalea alkalilenta]|uniref:Iron-siderophore ABC transporter permease n=1 Tax=Halotalea alkalilenta TaxID=376489 RepID=A0A172YDZ5_9GAMM|nr:iron ABC transporter permease [Halotalea alkalilenta]ANF57491.1 iron-siderophore ABC transporter permease [Halotalea alkalilenta]
MTDSLSTGPNRPAAPGEKRWQRSVDLHLAKNRRSHRLILLTALLMVLALCLDVATGPGDYPISAVIETLLSPSSMPPLLQVVVWEIRLPIALMAVLVGAALAMAGAQMQTILANPLADPFTLGISSAASFGAALAIIIGLPSLLGAQPGIAASAFAAAMIAAMAVWALSRLQGVSTQIMVLIGVAIMFFFHSALGLLQFIASSEALQQLVFWTLGSLSRADWSSVILLALAITITVPVFLHFGWRLTALRLGELQARAMGVEVVRLRLVIMICCALLTATSVAFVGTIGFIGLVAPHIARLLVGEDQRRLLPMSALTGAVLMSCSSSLAKLLVPGTLLPIGLITAMVGLPFFVSLVLRSRREI